MRTNQRSAPPPDLCLKQFREAGFALHYLHPGSKRPIGNEWSTAPVASLDELIATYQPGNNLGVRLGMPSQVVDGSFLHILDVDVRIPELADEAWDKVRELFEGIDLNMFPTVISGSGGASRHIYFTSSKPFYSRKLAVSEGKYRDVDGSWRYEYEVELFGSGKQVAMPPSIHPDTGKAYVWEREFDFDMLKMGIGPHIPAAHLEKLATAESETYAFETREPLTFKLGQLESELDELDDAHIEDYHEWVAIGAALHHQFGGSNEGYELWVKISKRSAKFKEKEMPAKWRSFGRNRRAPITLATVRQWVLDARHENVLSQFDDIDVDGLDDDDDVGNTDPLDDLLGTPADPVAPADPIDDLDSLINGAISNTSTELDWKSLLDFNQDGGLRPTLHNATVAVEHDPRVREVLAYNELTQSVVQRRTPGSKSSRRKNAAKRTLQLDSRVWNVIDPVNGDNWTEQQDAEVRRIFEAPVSQGGFGTQFSERNMRDAINTVARKLPFHPIREYLQSLIWDHKPRVEKLFIQYLGCEDHPYYREAATITLVAAVARVFEPGCKWDLAPIIEGGQGIRKSSFIRILGRQWYSSLQADFGNPQKLVEATLGKWILELAELQGFYKTEIRQLKNVMSTSTDRVRLSYDKRARDFPRQSQFWGSTNDSLYLADASGGRRWLPIQCRVQTINTDDLERQIDQIWAEAFCIYESMREKQPKGDLPLYLRNPEAQKRALELQESRRIETDTDSLAGQIKAWLSKPIVETGFDDVEPDSEPKYRDTVCGLEVWYECMNAGDRVPGRSDSLKIGAALRSLEGWDILPNDKRPVHPKYGSQRTYYRLPAAGA